MLKKFLFILSFVFLFSNIVMADTVRVVNMDQTEIKNEILYVTGEDNPFTGIVKDYFENGNIKGEFVIKDGLQDGVTKRYYENSKVKNENNYKNGKVEGLSRSYYEDGKLEAEVNFSDGIKSGTFKTYYPNGNIEAEGTFVNDKESGITRVYYSNGKLGREIEYSDGVQNGKYIEYSEDGKILKKTTYVNGEEKKSVPMETIALILAVIGVIALSVMKIMTALPSFKSLEDYQKERILKKLIEYNNNDESLHSTYRLNGCGTGFYTVRSFVVYDEKIKVLAKMLSLLFLPMPITFGYIVCYKDNRILASISKKDFKVLKKEIEEEMVPY